jgi:hypothetical protein
MNPEIKTVRIQAKMLLLIIQRYCRTNAAMYMRITAPKFPPALFGYTGSGTQVDRHCLAFIPLPVSPNGVVFVAADQSINISTLTG